MLRVNQFLRAVLKQPEGKGSVTVGDAKFTEREPEAYTDEEVDTFLKACGPFHAPVFNTLLPMCGTIVTTSAGRQFVAT